MGLDAYRVLYRPMRFLISEEAEIIVNELHPVDGARYYIDEEAVEKLEKAGMDTESLQELRKRVKRSEYGGFDVSIS